MHARAENPDIFKNYNKYEGIQQRAMQPPTSAQNPKEEVKVESTKDSNMHMNLQPAAEGEPMVLSQV